MSDTCGTVTYSASCADDSLDFSLSNGSSEAVDVLLSLPDGAELLDQSGNVVYTVTGSPSKCKVRLP